MFFLYYAPTLRIDNVNCSVANQVATMSISVAIKSHMKHLINTIKTNNALLTTLVYFGVHFMVIIYTKVVLGYGDITN